MKKMILLMSAGFILFCCSSDPEPTILEQVLHRMEGNAFVIDDSFEGTVEIAGGAGIDVLIATTNRDEFIKEMLDQTKDVFDDVIDDSRQAMGWGSSSYQYASVGGLYIFKEYLDLIPVGIEGPNPGSGVLDKFSADLDAELDRQGLGEQILIESTTFGASGSGSVPIESFSLNFGEIKFVKQQIDGFIVQFDRPVDLDEAVDDFVAEHPETVVLIGALYPAIQKVRESSTNSYGGLTSISGGTVTTAEREAWDKKMRRAAFLAGVRALVTDFEASDEDHLSIMPQRAMYEAVLVLNLVRAYEN